MKEQAGCFRVLATLTVSPTSILWLFVCEARAWTASWEYWAWYIPSLQNSIIGPFCSICIVMAPCPSFHFVVATLPNSFPNAAHSQAQDGPHRLVASIPTPVTVSSGVPSGPVRFLPREASDLLAWLRNREESGKGAGRSRWHANLVVSASPGAMEESRFARHVSAEPSHWNNAFTQLRMPVLQATNRMSCLQWSRITPPVF